MSCFRGRPNDIGENEKLTQENFGNTGRRSKKIWISNTNERKTKYRVMGTNNEEQESNPKITRIGKNYEFQKVDEFAYLGGSGEGCARGKEIQTRIAIGNQKFGNLRMLMRFKHLSRKTKMRIYLTIIRPTATYVCETWVQKTRGSIGSMGAQNVEDYSRRSRDRRRLEEKNKPGSV